MSPEITKASFMRRVEFDPNGGCWLWSGKIASNGYGRTAAGPYFDARDTGAHRMSYALFVGSFPEDKMVLHKCDVRACVNPDHLFLGDQLDNIRDMDRKGRRRTVSHHGAGSGMAKLNDDSVLKIRQMYADGLGLSEIGRVFGVTPQNINHIKNKRTWRHV